jgi:hypothetical protein
MDLYWSYTSNGRNGGVRRYQRRLTACIIVLWSSGLNESTSLTNTSYYLTIMTQVQKVYVHSSTNRRLVIHYDSETMVW